MIEHGDVFVDQYTEEAVRSPRLLELARKVSAVHEPAFDALGPGHRHHVELTIEFADGSRESRVVEAPRGSSARPLSEQEIGEKFDKLVKAVLPVDRVRILKEKVLSMETLADACSLSKLLKTDGPGENA